MIEYLFIVVGILAVLHYVYETCILPDLRLQFVYQFFQLRDELRNAKLNKKITDERAYRVLQESLNNGIRSVFIADYLLISEVRHAIRTNRHLATQTEKRVQTLDASQDPLIQELRHKSRRIFSCALLAGMGTWFLYLVPIACVVVFYKTLKDIVKATLAMPASNLSSATADRDGCNSNLALANAHIG